MAVWLVPIRAVALLLLMAGVASSQDTAPPPNANDCLIWTGNSLLANPYFLVGKNICNDTIRIEYRYEEDVGTGCFGPSSCTALLMPNEIKRFTAGTIRFWACHAPAVPKFPDITRDGSCE